MSKEIDKCPEEFERLMHEIEAFFEMTSGDRTKVEKVVYKVTDPEERPYTYKQLCELIGVQDLKIAGQPLESENYMDEDGNPEGGWAEAPGLQIRWQRGALDFESEAEPWNGCFLVTVLEAAKRQLEFYQGTKFKCADNENAMAMVEMAIRILNKRQLDRFERGVRGGHEE